MHSWDKIKKMGTSLPRVEGSGTCNVTDCQTPGYFDRDWAWTYTVDQCASACACDMGLYSIVTTGLVAHNTWVATVPTGRSTNSMMPLTMLVLASSLATFFPPR